MFTCITFPQGQKNPFCYAFTIQHPLAASKTQEERGLFLFFCLVSKLSVFILKCFQIFTDFKRERKVSWERKNAGYGLLLWYLHNFFSKTQPKTVYVSLMMKI